MASQLMLLLVAVPLSGLYILMYWGINQLRAKLGASASRTLREVFSDFKHLATWGVFSGALLCMHWVVPYFGSSLGFIAGWFAWSPALSAVLGPLIIVSALMIDFGMTLIVFQDVEDQVAVLGAWGLLHVLCFLGAAWLGINPFVFVATKLVALPLTFCVMGLSHLTSKVMFGDAESFVARLRSFPEEYLRWARFFCLMTGCLAYFQPTFTVLGILLSSSTLPSLMLTSSVLFFGGLAIPPLVLLTGYGLYRGMCFGFTLGARGVRSVCAGAKWLMWHGFNITLLHDAVPGWFMDATLLLGISVLCCGTLGVVYVLSLFILVAALKNFMFPGVCRTWWRGQLKWHEVVRMSSKGAYIVHDVFQKQWHTRNENAQQDVRFYPSLSVFSMKAYYDLDQAIDAQQNQEVSKHDVGAGLKGDAQRLWQNFLLPQEGAERFSDLQVDEADEKASTTLKKKLGAYSECHFARFKAVFCKLCEASTEIQNKRFDYFKKLVHLGPQDFEMLAGMVEKPNDDQEWVQEKNAGCDNISGIWRLFLDGFHIKRGKKRLQQLKHLDIGVERQDGSVVSDIGTFTAKRFMVLKKVWYRIYNIIQVLHRKNRPRIALKDVMALPMDALQSLEKMVDQPEHKLGEAPDAKQSGDHQRVVKVIQDLFGHPSCKFVQKGLGRLQQIYSSSYTRTHKIRRLMMSRPSPILSNDCTPIFLKS